MNRDERPSRFHVKRSPTPPGLAFLDRALGEASDNGLLRVRDTGPRPAVSFCSNDYLGLAERQAPGGAAGAGASRLVGGDHAIHAALETKAASLVQLPEALVFTSGYAANVGVLAALAGPEDLIVSDALAHASLIDGARLSRARVVVVPHLDLDAVRGALRSSPGRRSFVLTESYFSMDADSPDLRQLRSICDEHGAALIVDEAHALGVLGPDGRGLCVASGLRPDVLVGTFGKAFGAGGAFVAGCSALCAWLWNRARSFVFSTGLSPAVARGALHGLEAAGAEPGRRERVLRVADDLRRLLSEQGLDLRGYGHVIPWVVGDPREAMHLGAALRDGGYDVRAIRPPSVPKGTARLRLTASARHTPEDVHGLAKVVAGARESVRALG